jgi:hypothetical protein
MWIVTKSAYSGQDARLRIWMANVASTALQATWACPAVPEVMEIVIYARLTQSAGISAATASSA